MTFSKPRTGRNLTTVFNSPTYKFHDPDKNQEKASQHFSSPLTTRTERWAGGWAASSLLWISPSRLDNTEGMPDIKFLMQALLGLCLGKGWKRELICTVRLGNNNDEIPRKNTIQKKKHQDRPPSPHLIFYDSLLVQY